MRTKNKKMESQRKNKQTKTFCLSTHEKVNTLKNAI